MFDESWLKDQYAKMETMGHDQFVKEFAEAP
jgi:hypothetical protein